MLINATGSLQLVKAFPVSRLETITKREVPLVWITMYECSFESHPSPNSDARYSDRSASWALVHAKLQGEKKKKSLRIRYLASAQYDSVLGLNLKPRYANCTI